MIWMCGNAHHYPTICHRYGICGHTQSKVPWSMLGTCKFRIISRFLFYMCVCVLPTMIVENEHYAMSSSRQRTSENSGFGRTSSSYPYTYALFAVVCNGCIQFNTTTFLVFNNSHNINSKLRTKFEIRLWFVGNKLQEKYAMVTFLCPNSFSCTFR